jgi:hypothetical protein
LNEQQVGRGDGELGAAAVVVESRAHGQPRAGVAGEVMRRRHAAGIRALANSAGLAPGIGPAPRVLCREGRAGRRPRSFGLWEGRRG